MQDNKFRLNTMNYALIYGTEHIYRYLNIYKIIFIFLSLTHFYCISQQIETYSFNFSSHIFQSFLSYFFQSLLFNPSENTVFQICPENKSRLQTLPIIAAAPLVQNTVSSQSSQ